MKIGGWNVRQVSRGYDIVFQIFHDCREGYYSMTMFYPYPRNVNPLACRYCEEEFPEPLQAFLNLMIL